MKVESIEYSVAGVKCRGELAHDETAKGPRPLLLVCPNWAGVTPRAIAVARELVGFLWAVMQDVTVPAATAV